MSSTGPFDPGSECRFIAGQFREALGACGASSGHGAGTADPGIVPGNIVVLLPYALCEALPFEGGAAAARIMATGNAFGAAHFLQQDRWLDGDEAPRPESARLSDTSFTRFVRAYSRLFPPDSVFWDHLDRYLNEYFTSLEWEADVLCSGEGARSFVDGRLPDALTLIGRKMSPLKATAAAAGLLSGRLDCVARAERVIEDFHAAYQLADDMDDLAVDLEAKRWSVAAWFLATSAGLESPRDARDADELLRSGAGCGALEELVRLISARYARAAGDAALLGSGILEAYLRAAETNTERVLGRMARRMTLAGPEGNGGCSFLAMCPSVGLPQRSAGGAVHDFEVDGSVFVYDSRSGLLFEADRPAADALDWLRSGAPATGLDVMRLNHGSGPVDEALSEITRLAGSAAGAAAATAAGTTESTAADTAARAPTRGPDRCPEYGFPSLTALASVALNVAGGCNLACDYCYLGLEGGKPRLMSDDIAHRAVDLLFDESFSEPELSVVFFGGEPLLNAGLVARTARYARGRAREEGRRISFHMTTNGTLLTPDIAAMLLSEGVRVLVSLDGHAEVHDAHRAFRNGAGSYDTIASNLKRLPADMRFGVRSTVTEASAPLVDIVAHLKGLGAGVVHLAPVSGEPMGRAFADRLVEEFGELARTELAAARRGEMPSAGCFLEPIASLELGRARLTPCGAGARYVSVASDGGLFLCHRFAGDGAYRVGTVTAGLDRFAVGDLLARMALRSSACSRCWALGLCGGACFHDVSSEPEEFDASRSERCRVIRRVFELSMWLYSSLPAELRARLRGSARAAARPEVGVTSATARGV